MSERQHALCPSDGPRFSVRVAAGAFFPRSVFGGHGNRTAHSSLNPPPKQVPANGGASIKASPPSTAPLRSRGSAFDGRTRN